MDLKTFLADKNYAHLMGELEANFTFVPKGPEPWSIRKLIEKRFGNSTYLIAGNGVHGTKIGEKEPSTYLFISVCGCNGVPFLTAGTGNGGNDYTREYNFKAFISKLSEGQNVVGRPVDYDLVWEVIKKMYKGQLNGN